MFMWVCGKTIQLYKKIILIYNIISIVNWVKALETMRMTFSHTEIVYSAPET